MRASAKASQSATRSTKRATRRCSSSWMSMMSSGLQMVAISSYHSDRRKSTGAGESATRARARAEVAAGGAVGRRRQAVHEGGPHGGAELGQRERLGEEGFAGSQAHAILLDRGGAVRRHEEDLHRSEEHTS